MIVKWRICSKKKKKKKQKKKKQQQQRLAQQLIFLPRTFSDVGVPFAVCVCVYACLRVRACVRASVWCCLR